MKELVIIGGGIMGLACAYRAARAGARVTLFERGALGSGATLASLGALWPARASINGPLQRLQRKSLWMMEDFLREVAAAAVIAIPFRRNGHIEIFTSATAAADAQRDVQAVGDWPTFGHAQAVELEATGEFGVLHSHVSAQVDVAAYVAALAAACRKMNVALHEQTPVNKITFDTARVTQIAAARENGPAITLSPDSLLITAGAWTAQLHPLLAACAPTRPAKGQALEVETARDIPQIILKRGPIYIVPWDRRVLIGATTEKAAGFDTVADLSTAQHLFAQARALLPALADARIVRHWAGLRPDAPKHRPIMGQVPGVENLFVCAGHYKTGIGMSPAVSATIAALALGQTAELPPDFTPFAPRVR